MKRINSRNIFLTRTAPLLHSTPVQQILTLLFFHWLKVLLESFTLSMFTRLHPLSLTISQCQVESLLLPNPVLEDTCLPTGLEKSTWLEIWAPGPHLERSPSRAWVAAAVPERALPALPPVCLQRLLRQWGPPPHRRGTPICLGVARNHFDCSHECPHLTVQRRRDRTDNREARPIHSTDTSTWTTV